MRKSTFVLVVLGLAGLLGCGGGQSGTGMIQDPNQKPGPDDRTVDCMADQGQTDGPMIIGGQRLTTSGPVGKGTVKVLLALDGGMATSCTGSLIGRNVVMTAAHCIKFARQEEHYVPERLWAERTQVLFGADTVPACRPESREVDMVVVHPDWNPDLKRHAGDVALIRLKEPAPSWTQPLPVVTDFPRSVLTDKIYVAGFGKDLDDPGDNLRRLPPPLKITEVRAARNPGMRNANAASAEFLVFDQKNGTGICKGDSGGPALMRVDGVIKVIGVASVVMFDPNSEPTCLNSAAHSSVSYFNQWFYDVYETMLNQDSTPNPFLGPRTAVSR